MRTKSDNQRGNGGWLHRLKQDWQQSSPRLSSSGTQKTQNSAKHSPSADLPRQVFVVPSDGVAAYEKKLGRKATSVHEYRLADGRVLGLVARFDLEDGSKRVLPVSYLTKDVVPGFWLKAMEAPRIVYNLPQLSKCKPDSLMLVVEGEKCADALNALDLVATTSSGGSKASNKTDWSPLAGMDVVIVPDNDKPGVEYAEAILETLTTLDPPPRVRVLRLSGIAAGEDIVDWLESGNTKEDLLAEIDVLQAYSTVQRLAVEQPSSEPEQPWPSIEAFESDSLPDFPTDVLPTVLRQWVAAESIATQTPPDLAGLLSLAVVSSTIARRIVVKPRTDWSEPVNLFTTVVLEPANRKSAVFADATRSLREVELAELETARREIARDQSQRRQAERRLDKLERQLAKMFDDAQSHERDELAVQLAEWPEPALPRRVVADVTSEKLVMLLADQNGRIASMSSEGGVFDLMSGMYNKAGGAQFDVYLKGHAGDDLIADRVSRRSVSVLRPAITAAYTVQPEVIRNLGSSAVFRGRGLLARFLYAVPGSWLGARATSPPPMPPGVSESYDTLIRALASSKYEGELTLNIPATTLLEQWLGEVETMLADGGELESIRDWGGKLVGQTLRLAAVLHCVRNAFTNPTATPIDQESIRSAIKLARYLVPHAQQVLSQLSTDDHTHELTARCQQAIEWMYRHELRRFTRRELHQGKKSFKRQVPEALEPVLEELTERGYIRPVASQTGKPGRPRSREYEVNPEVVSRSVGE